MRGTLRREKDLRYACANTVKKTILAAMLAVSLLVSDAHTETESPPPLLHFKHPIADNSYFTLRDTYFVTLLALALEKSGNRHEINTVLLPPMQETRSAIFLAQGRYNVHWLMTNNSHEEKLIPIRIPLFKGLIGWRLMFIHNDSRAAFAGIKNIKQLRALAATQGVDWPDASILKSNGFLLRPAIDWNSLVELISLKRADYFPRAITEIWKEQGNAAKRDLVVEEQLALHYPAAYYFFVAPGLEQHAAALERGLMRAISDGSFDRLFNAFFADDLTASKLNQRTVFTINNPLLPPLTPLNRPKLWYRTQSQ